MEITIKTRGGYALTPEVERYARERFGAFEKFVMGDESARCDVEIGRAEGHAEHGDVWRVETNLVRAGENLRAEATGESENAAIDALKDEMIRQLRQDKDRSQSILRRTGAKIKDWMRFGQ